MESGGQCAADVAGRLVAAWETPVVAGGAGGSAGPAPVAGLAAPPGFGNLKAVTTRMRPGYLRKNGVPYSADAVLTEYWEVHKQRNGDQWLVITTLVDDPKYLQLAVGDESQLQEGAGRIEVGPDAVLGEMVARP